MKDRTTVIITILIVLIAGIGVYAESFLKSYNNPGSDKPAFREVVLNDQGTGNNSSNSSDKPKPGTGNITENTTQTGTGNKPGLGTGTGSGTRTGTGPVGTRNDGTGGQQKTEQKIQIAGSTSVQPVAQKLADEYNKKHPNVKINVAAGGSGVGITRAKDGTADIGTSSRDLKEEEKPGLNQFVIGKDGIAIVVNANNPVSDLTTDQIRDIFSGKITNWKEVGGPDKTINVVTREEGSGTRGAFEEIIMKGTKIKGDAIVQSSAGAIKQTVAQDPNAVGYISLASLSSEVKALKISGVAPSEQTVLDGTYKVQRPFLFLTKGEPTGAVKEFIDWVLSPEGHAVIKSEKVVPVETKKTEQKIQIAGSTSVQPVAQKLADEYNKKHPNVKINVAAGGSGVGITRAKDGTADIGTSSRDLKEEEKPGLNQFVIGKDGIAIVVNANNPVSDLTTDQIRDIFSGKITNWKEVGGPDKTINVVTREEGSGTRGAFEEIIMKGTKIKGDAIVQSSAGAIKQTVAQDPNAVGYISLASLSSEVKALKISGVAPSEQTVLDGTYKVQRPFLFLTKGEPTGAVKEFIDWVLSPEGHAVIKSEKVVPVK
jgi:phosphate transport system substrate-binding protein